MCNVHCVFSFYLSHGFSSGTWTLLSMHSAHTFCDCFSFRSETGVEEGKKAAAYSLRCQHMLEFMRVWISVLIRFHVKMIEHKYPCPIPFTEREREKNEAKIDKKSGKVVSLRIHYYFLFCAHVECDSLSLSSISSLVATKGFNLTQMAKRKDE